MKKLNLIAGSLVLAGSALLVAYPVFAHCGKCAADGKKIAALLDQNKLTLARAIESAEKHSKGRAVSVISKLAENDKLAVEVYCMAGDKIMRCNIQDTGGVGEMKEVREFPITQETERHAHGEAKMITNQTVEAGCGGCIFSMKGATGCDLAVKIDGKPYWVQGANVDAHATGLCTAGKKAVVSGRVEGDKFIATDFKLQS